MGRKTTPLRQALPSSLKAARACASAPARLDNRVRTDTEGVYKVEMSCASFKIVIAVAAMFIVFPLRSFLLAFALLLDALAVEAVAPPGVEAPPCPTRYRGFIPAAFASFTIRW